MKKFFLTIAGVIVGLIVGLAIIATAVFIREKNINNYQYEI